VHHEDTHGADELADAEEGAGFEGRCSGRWSGGGGNVVVSIGAGSKVCVLERLMLGLEGEER
jgi:hypothetical protein